jgi:hypothetical protein
MTIHVLIQCSKKKSLGPEKNLIWSESTNLESWRYEWENAPNRILVEKLYSGRSIKKEFDFLKSNEEVEGYVISAGAGLVRLNARIPSYESTFFLNSGPKYSKWYKLPHGGLLNLDIIGNDTIVSFAAPNYHRALLADPEFHRLAPRFIVANTSPLSTNDSVTSIAVHPRTVEFLGVAYIDLNSELLNIYLTSGQKGLEEIYEKCTNLPPPDERRTVSDNELFSIVESLESISSIIESVEYIRHTLGISASYERIRETILSVRNKI